MRSLSFPKLLATAATCAVLTMGSWAQEPAAEKGPISKLYVAEVKGEGNIQVRDRVFAAKQTDVFDASGAVIETKAGAHTVLVYSNGTGLFVGPLTRVEIVRFVQEPFVAQREAAQDTPYEPSVSQSNVRVPFGAVGICTRQLISGSSMVYTTPEATITIRGGRLTIEARPGETSVDLLEGDVTVRHVGGDADGEVLHAGERALVRAPAAGEEPTVIVAEIPKAFLKIDEDRVAMACNARLAATFEVDEAAGADQEIEVRPTVPQVLPNNIVISPDRLPGT